MSLLQHPPSTAPLAVYVTPNDVLRCQQLAATLQLPLVEEDVVEGGESREVKTEKVSPHYAYWLTYTPQGLALQQTGPKAAGPVLVDFVSGVASHRRNQGGSELIVKAVGDTRPRPSVLDATAGLGRDSFVLASRGYSVTLCERSPVVACLLQDGLERAAQNEDPELRAVIDQMQLEAGDAVDYLQRKQAEPPGVIVIDPMFPPSKKTALVKKDMRAFHQVVGADLDSDQLLEAALTAAVYRVVVKRPLKAEFLSAKKPNFSVSGKAIRFDIYTKKALNK